MCMYTHITHGENHYIHVSSMPHYVVVCNSHISIMSASTTVCKVQAPSWLCAQASTFIPLYEHTQDCQRLAFKAQRCFCIRKIQDGHLIGAIQAYRARQHARHSRRKHLQDVTRGQSIHQRCTAMHAHAIDPCSVTLRAYIDTRRRRI